MKKTIKRLSIAVTSLAVALVTSGSALAWGPSRPTYTIEAPADHATFNSITNNPAVGDERDFVRVAEKKADGSAYYRSDIQVEPGKDYEVWIYYHNDASATFNDAAHNYVGVARGTKMISSFPTELKAGEKGKIIGKIRSDTTSPTTVWDEAYITATEDITLHYVLASAKIYNQWDTNGSVLSTNLFSEEGTFIGSSQLTGLILGCDEYAGQVVYTIRTAAVNQPVEPKPEEPDPEPTPNPEPTPTPTPDVPVEPTPEPTVTVTETVDELPKTGPAEVALAIVVVLALVAGIVYWWHTGHAVKKATRTAKGRGKRK